MCFGCVFARPCSVTAPVERSVTAAVLNHCSQPSSHPSPHPSHVRPPGFLVGPNRSVFKRETTHPSILTPSGRRPDFGTDRSKACGKHTQKEKSRNAKRTHANTEENTIDASVPKLPGEVAFSRNRHKFFFFSSLKTPTSPGNVGTDASIVFFSHWCIYPSHDRFPAFCKNRAHCVFFSLEQLSVPRLFVRFFIKPRPV